MEKISDKIKRFLTKFFLLDIPKFSKVVVNKSVIENMMDFAKANYPKEFVALLSGEVKNDKLIVEGLVYQPYTGTKSSSWMRINLPSHSRVVGSVHSHPSSSTRPSNADLQFFSKNGVMHFIIGYPYRPTDIACYDLYGEIRKFYIDMKN